MEPDISNFDQWTYLSHEIGVAGFSIAILATACIRKPRLPKLLWSGMILMALSQIFPLATLICGGVRMDEFLHACRGSEPDIRHFSITVPSFVGSQKVSILYYQVGGIFSLIFSLAFLLSSIAIWRIAKRLLASNLSAIEPS